MPSLITTEPHVRPNLPSLPRELRDQIYGNVVTYLMPIKLYCGREFVHSARLEQLRATIRLIQATSGTAIASEVYEQFFQTNWFECDLNDTLPMFLDSSMKSLFRSHEPSTFPVTNSTRSHGFASSKLSFFAMTWSTISHRNLLFVDIKIFDKTVERGQVNPVERTIQTIADVCTQIRAKIGNGLTIRVQKDWAENSRPGHGDCFLHNPILENISWMWEETSDETRARVQQGSGTHRECIQVLMSIGRSNDNRSLGDRLTRLSICFWAVLLRRVHEGEE